MKWTWLVSFASQCEDLCEREGRGKAQALAQGQVELDELRHALREGSNLVRRKSLHILTFFNWEEVADDILWSLGGDPSPVVRHEAAYFLGLLKHEEAVFFLIKALRDDPCELVRHEAAEALGDLGSSLACESLLKALSDSSLIVRETAEIALEQLTGGEQMGEVRKLSKESIVPESS